MNLNTAKIFNLYPKKGTIAVGSDADFTVVDMDLEKKVIVEDLKSFCDFSLFEGWVFKGWPVMTIVRGEVVMENGEISGQVGFGKYTYRRVPRGR